MKPLIIEQDVEAAFKKTCQHRNGYSLEDCLSSGKDRGEKHNTVHSIIEIMRIEGFSLGSRIIFSDGEVCHSYVTYQLGDFTVILKEFNSTWEWPFNSSQEFVQWINKQEQDLLTSARELLESK